MREKKLPNWEVHSCREAAESLYWRLKDFHDAYRLPAEVEKRLETLVGEFKFMAQCPDAIRRKVRRKRKEVNSPCAKTS